MPSHNTVPRGDIPSENGAQTLYQSGRTRVTRLVSAGDVTVIRKEATGPGAAPRIARERAVLDRLADVEGVAHLAASPAELNALLLDDVSGDTLAFVPTPLSGADLLDLALRVSRTMAEVHAHGVVHHDINPTNIVLSQPQHLPVLIDFDLATMFANDQPAVVEPGRIAGTLAYLAPEQTGRTTREVDHRADLYGLGATLYELATGRPPFASGDPLRITHEHLARVPKPPTEINSAIPAGLSAIIMHLLEKEPDRRYQTAEGLIYDLVVLRDSLAGGVSDGGSPANDGFGLGSRDFPSVLTPSAPLIGREAEVDVLARAVASVAAGPGRILLVSGPSGVGKTALINELRPMTAAVGGLFAAGKFDENRRDRDSDGVRQALRAMGRLLLTEPEDRLDALRERMLRALGPNAGLVAAVLPEFAVVLDITPDSDPGDPLKARDRIRRVGLDLIRAIASPSRPVVLAIDDVQWGGQSAAEFFDALLTDEAPDGLLVVGVYRSEDMYADHPFAKMMSRWERLGLSPTEVAMHNLARPQLGMLLSDMLGLEAVPAADLAAEVMQSTNGNPFDTIELINALRRDGDLVAGTDGWHWNTQTLRERLGRTDVADLIALRINAMPTTTQALLKVMACLGGQADSTVLAEICGQDLSTVEGALKEALEGGLVVRESGGERVLRYPHDRVQEAVLGRLGPMELRELRLLIARRAAARPDLRVVAAEQYTQVADAIVDPDERRSVIRLLQEAATHARLVGNQLAVERQMRAALDLMGQDVDRNVLIAVQTARHVALSGLGRLSEADEVFERLTELVSDPLDFVEATCAQIYNRTKLGRPDQAVALGVGLLRRLGRSPPPPEAMEASFEHGLSTLYRWLDHGDSETDLARPDIADPNLLAIATVIDRLIPAALFCDQPMSKWLTLQAVEIWAEHGPAAPLVGAVAHIPFVVAPMGQDRTGYRVVRRVLDVSEARGYHPGTSHVRLLYAGTAGHWFEPIEDNIRHAYSAREGLLQGGDLQNAALTYYVTISKLLDCSPSLDGYLVELESGLTFMTRVGDDYVGEAVRAYGRLVHRLRGQDEDDSEPMGRPSDRRLAEIPMTFALIHTVDALSAAIFGDEDELFTKTEELPTLLILFPSTYLTILLHVLRALAVTQRARAAPAHGQSLIDEAREWRSWLADRAVDAPANIGHLLWLVDAEIAWAEGDFHRAANAFDAAQRDVSTRQRPWQSALIAERAGYFHIAHGLGHLGYHLLAESRRGYDAWGAAAKVKQLEDRFPRLTGWEPYNQLPERAEQLRSSGSLTSGVIDLIAILDASRALSSETNLDRLRSRVVEILTAMTGATMVRVLMRDSDTHDWTLPTQPEGATMSLEEAGDHGLVPLSALRYVERTREPLVVKDATSDDRFARDPYFAALDFCSLLVVPIFNRGKPQAMLLLENGLIRGAFPAERLDGIMLIAGQLAVSLDNALVYASLERRVAERTQALALANQRLERLSITDPLTGLPNRRRLEDALTVRWGRAQQSTRSVAIAMIDIDHFKLFNDHNGHVAGDECLIRIATALRENVRDVDLVARYGGEEFAVVMNDVDLPAAEQLAERLRASVESLAEPNGLGDRGFVTVSIGVAAMVPSRKDSYSILLELADAELYRAKQAGRNTVSGARA